jgi:hypothetical protein
MAPNPLRVAVSVAILAAASAATAGATVDIREAQAQRCTRAGVATSLMAYFGLLGEGRFAATQRLWLSKPRLPYAYMLFLTVNRQVLHARRGSELPQRSEQWLAKGGTTAEVVAVDARIDRAEPRRTGYALWWIRAADDGSELVLGAAKGVWDCERRRIGRLVGSERTFESEEVARTEAGRHCGRRGSSTIRRYGQTAVLCGPRR